MIKRVKWIDLHTVPVTMSECSGSGRHRHSESRTTGMISVTFSVTVTVLSFPKLLKFGVALA